MRHCTAMRLRVRYKSIAAVIRNIEPLMSISRPRVRGLDTGQQVPVRRTGRNPQAECAVDMNPCSVSLSERDENLKWVECPDIQIAGLQDHDRRSIALRGKC